MEVSLDRLIEDWIPTTGFEKLFIERPAGVNEPKAWLSYENYPVRWFCNIFSDKVHSFHHGEQFEIKACDPEFFYKLGELVKHRMGALECPLCKAEVAQIYTNYD